MDANVEYAAQQMVMPDALPLEDFSRSWYCATAACSSTH